MVEMMVVLMVGKKVPLLVVGSVEQLAVPMVAWLVDQKDT